MADRTAVSEQVESEIKLAVPAVFALPPLDAAGSPTAVPRARRMLRATYHDTADLRLARSGATLRHRTGEGSAQWTLKLPTATEGDRLELSVRAPATAIPAELRSLVTAYVRDGALAEVVRLTTRRDTWSLQDDEGTEQAELVDDLVSVLSDGKVVARFRELEIERRGIAEPALDDLVARLGAAGAVRGAFRSKLAQALGPRADAAPDVPAAQRVRPGDPAAALVVEAVRDGVRRLLAQDPRVRLGRADAVHQMRVACRRLRSDLATFRPLLVPGDVEGLRAELAWLADELGSARDLEVLRSGLAETFGADRLQPLDAAAFARLDAELAAREATAVERAVDALDDPRYVELLVHAVAYAEDPPVTETAHRPVKDVLPALVAAVVGRLDAAVERLSRPAPDARWHRARIRAKRARYAAETAGRALGSSAARLAAAMEQVQEVLGEHQDAAVAGEAVLDIAAHHPDDPALVLLCGRLAERERTALRDARRRFGPTWARASARPVRRWLS